MLQKMKIAREKSFLGGRGKIKKIKKMPDAFVQKFCPGKKQLIFHGLHVGKYVLFITNDSQRIHQLPILLRQLIHVSLLKYIFLV